MSFVKVAAASVLVAALGAARGAEAGDADGASSAGFPELRRDPLEFCAPEDMAVTETPPPDADAAELARKAEEELALERAVEAERLLDEAIEALRVQAAGDVEIEARLRDLRRKLLDMRTEDAAAEGFGKLGLKLSGVAWSKANPVALINDQLLVPGDSIEGAKIERISPGEVVFVFNGVRIRKSLLRPSVDRVEGIHVIGRSGERE